MRWVAQLHQSAGDNRTRTKVMRDGDVLSQLSFNAPPFDWIIAITVTCIRRKWCQPTVSVYRQQLIDGSPTQISGHGKPPCKAVGLLADRVSNVLCFVYGKLPDASISWAQTDLLWSLNLKLIYLTWKNTRRGIRSSISHSLETISSTISQILCSQKGSARHR